MQRNAARCKTMKEKKRNKIGGKKVKRTKNCKKEQKLPYACGESREERDALH